MGFCDSKVVVCQGCKHTHKRYIHIQTDRQLRLCCKYEHYAHAVAGGLTAYATNTHPDAAAYGAVIKSLDEALD